MSEKDIKKLVDAMKDVFPTAEMVKRGFDDIQKQINTVEENVRTNFNKMDGEIAAVRTDFSQLTSTVDDLRERVAHVPTMPDMERLLEKTYNFSKLQAEHDRMKKLMQEKLGVEV